MNSQHLDVVQQIKIDHDNVRELCERYKAESNMDMKKAIANTLVREMSMHGDAEEMSIYLKYKELGLASEAEHNKEEHAMVKKLVAEADTSRFNDPDYDMKLMKAVKVFMHHAEEEENDQLSKVKSMLSPEENDKAARDFLKARKMAPTHAHPMAPQSGGMAQMAAGGPAMMMDKAMDMMQGRQFVDLKHQHPDNM